MKRHTPELDTPAIDKIIGEFYATFDCRKTTPNLSSLHKLCLPNANFIDAAADHRVHHTLHSFIKPRQEAYNKGDICHFYEWELNSQTLTADKLAIRISHFQKHGIINQVPINQQAYKTFQLIHTDEGWKIVSLVWSAAISV